MVEVLGQLLGYHNNNNNNNRPNNNNNNNNQKKNSNNNKNISIIQKMIPLLITLLCLYAVVLGIFLLSTNK